MSHPQRIAILNAAVQDCRISSGLCDRLWLSQFLPCKSGPMESAFENSVIFNQIEHGPPESLDIHLVLDFQRKAIRYHLGANFEGCGGPDIFDVYDGPSASVVYWLEALKAEALGEANGADGDSEVSEEIGGVIREYPEAFERLIGRVRILQRWLKASDEEVAQALVLDPRPVWAEPLDPILHFLINAGSK